MKYYLLLAALALGGSLERSSFAAPPAGGSLGTPATPGSLGTPAAPGSLGTPATPGSLGTPATPGSLGTPATPGSLGTPVTPGALGIPATPGSLGSPVTPGLGNPIPPINPGDIVHPAPPGTLTPAPGVGRAGTLGTATGTSTGSVLSPNLPGSTVVPSSVPSLTPGLVQSESDRDLGAAVRSSLLNTTGPGAVPNSGIGQAGSTATGTLTPGAMQSVRIDSRAGAITLKGTVPTEADKQAIERRVLLTPGVHAIDNQLTIAPSASQTPSSSVVPRP